MRNRQWSAILATIRQREHMTARRLAEAAGIDPSYITRIERDGLVPRREKVEALAKALNTETDFLLLAAGYAPFSEFPAHPGRDFLDTAQMHEELVACLRALEKLSWEHQRDAARFIKVFLSSVTAGKSKD